MKLIVISSEKFFNEEAEVLSLLFDNGLSLLHLRKPQAAIQALEMLIGNIDEKYHQHIVLHDHFQLAKKFQLRGIHLNIRNHIIPEGFVGTVSASCHTIKELSLHTNKAYLFLSPIFDSISKSGYSASFSEQELLKAKENHFINEKIIALGGVCCENIPLARNYGFGGVAVMGYLWSSFFENQNTMKLISNFKKILYESYKES